MQKERKSNISQSPEKPDNANDSWCRLQQVIDDHAATAETLYSLAEELSQSEDVEDRFAGKIYGWLAAEKGHPKAQCWLAHDIYHGEAEDHDPAESVYLFARAAEQGESEAQLKLAGMYLRGEIVQKSFQKAVSLLARALVTDNQYILMSITKACEEGDIGEKAKRTVLQHLTESIAPYFGLDMPAPASGGNIPTNKSAQSGARSV